MILQHIPMLTMFIGWDLMAEILSLGKCSEICIKKLSMFPERFFDNVPALLGLNEGSTLSI